MTQEPDATGPVVVLCTGHRCAGLHALAGGGLAQVRRAVAASVDGVLVTTECLGACSRAPVAGVGRRAPGATTSTPLTWLAGADSPVLTDALTRWVAAPGPLPASLPAALSAAVVSTGSGIRLSTG